MRIYALHGLGLDGRIFDHLDLSHCSIHPIDHLDPRQDESWESYIQRHVDLVRQHHKGNEPCLLLGHSFGGLLAQEMAQHLSPEGIILVSTICTPAELPPTLSILRTIPAYKLWRRELVKRTYFLWGEKDGYNTPAERGDFYDMTDTHSDYYFNWAVHRIVHWAGDLNHGCPILRLHGDHDFVFPHKYIEDSSTLVVAGGSHIMIKSKAEIISRHIEAFVNEVSR